nr:immunoglobulin heavy chain junction region [Mus musculus]
CTRRPFDFW